MQPPQPPPQHEIVSVHAVEALIRRANQQTHNVLTVGALGGSIAATILLHLHLSLVVTVLTAMVATELFGYGVLYVFTKTKKP
jgi:hypothetical protein